MQTNYFVTDFLNQEKLPLVVSPIAKNISLSELLHCLREEKEFLHSHLLKYGAVLLRNCPVKNIDDFDRIVRILSPDNLLNYVGGTSPRTVVKDKIYTATDLPPSMKLLSHNEMSYVKSYPKHIYFYCDIAPEFAGETTLVSNRVVTNEIDESVKQKFQEKKIKYVHSYYEKNIIYDFINRFVKINKNWMEAFETSDKSIVQERCEKQGLSVFWHKSGRLEVNNILPAFATHPITQEFLWFNHAAIYSPQWLDEKLYEAIIYRMLFYKKNLRPSSAYYGDGSQINKSVVKHILDVYSKNTCSFRWQKGDVLLVDNILCMHGRNHYRGQRKIYVAMG